MVYGIVNKNTMKRVVLTTGEITPVFIYPSQALSYIDKILSSSKYCTVKKLGEKNGSSKKYDWRL